MANARHRSSATLLALVYAALVLYASLYPFAGWRWPPGQTLWALAALPSALYQSPFDVGSNLLGYLPLGALITLAALRSGVGARAAVLLALLLATGLSYHCEVLQQFLPGRVPAREDLAMNAAGAAAGTVLALALHAAGLVDRWNTLRARWFSGDAAVALALLVLWPVGLLFPAPVPLGLGQVGERLREWLAQALLGVPWAEPAYELLAAAAPPASPLRPLTELLIVALGLLAPAVVAYSVVAPGWRRLVMALGALALAMAAMALSTALNFGPEHIWAWLGPRTVPGLLLGTALALLLVPVSRRLVAGIGLVALTGLVVGVAQAPDDPYFAQSLRAWEQGRFVRFHGLAQWIGWMWPYAAMAWLLSRLGSRTGSR
ncbi:MAG: VanZ family protein [Rubrivivax sp.]|nr:VanZ family protein [Rubrivivax sp.]